MPFMRAPNCATGPLVGRTNSGLYRGTSGATEPPAAKGDPSHVKLHVVPGSRSGFRVLRSVPVRVLRSGAGDWFYVRDPCSRARAVASVSGKSASSKPQNREPERGTE